MQRCARRMLRSSLVMSRRIQHAVNYIHFKAISRQGEIDEQKVRSHFESLGDAKEALAAASQSARAYLARKSTHATHMAFSGFLDIVDAKLGKALNDETSSTTAHSESKAAERPDSPDSVTVQASSLAQLQGEFNSAAIPTSDQTKLVCQMFRDAQESAASHTRMEREWIDSQYRARLRKAIGAQCASASVVPNVARVSNVYAHPRCDTPDSVAGLNLSKVPDFTVSSRPGIQSPVHLQNVLACDPSGSQSLAVTCALLGDTGSGTCLIGEADFKRLRAAGFARRVPRLGSSVDQIAGIGAVNLVLYHASFHLNFGGVIVHFEDVPVLSGHDGILLGNDFHRVTRTIYDFDQCHDSEGSMQDGFIVLRDSQRRPVSDPVFFSHEPASGRTASTSLADSAVPLAFSPEALSVPKWSESLIRCRVPAAALGNHPILILPLDDDRLEALPILVSAGIYKPNEDGFVHIRVINPSQQPARVAQLAAIARFIIDPAIKDADLEFTSEEIIENIHRDPGCTHLMREDILHMLQTRRRLFASKLGWAHGYQHSLNIPPGTVPPNIPPRRLAPQEYAALKEAVDKQMKAGLLEYCSSPFNARPIMVPKLGGGWRCVLDYRRLNELVLKAGSGSCYPLPNIEHNLNSLAKAKWFTAIDLLSGFHQVEMIDGLSGKLATAFSTPWGQMCYTRMPMGLTSSPGAFMAVVDAALRGLPPGIAVAYCDDVLIPTDGDWNDHLRDVGLVFDRLIAAGFTVNPKKVFVGMREVGYLGYLVGAYGTRPNPERTKAIYDMCYEQIRTDASAASRFSGMISFYSRFLKNLHITLAPFHELKSKHADVPSILNSLKLRAAFEALRHQLATVTALTRPDYDKDFHIVVDTASSVGVGACLMQLEDVNDSTSLRPVAFWSHRLSNDERGWSVRDQECYGLVRAVREWRPYILGTHTRVRTDHRSLKYLMTTNHASGSRVQHWVADIQQYDLEIDWLPGPENVVADCFSRAVTLCLRAVFRECCDMGCFSSVGERRESTALTASAFHVSGPQGPPSTRNIPSRVGLCMVAQDPISGISSHVLFVNTPEGFGLPSCRYPVNTTMSYRNAVSRIINETFAPSSVSHHLAHVPATALQFRSRCSHDGVKRSYYYACRLSKPHALTCRNSTAAVWVDISDELRVQELQLSDDDQAFCANIIAHQASKRRPYGFWRAHNYQVLLRPPSRASVHAAAACADDLPRFSTGHTVESDGAMFCDTVADSTVAVQDHILPNIAQERVIAVDLEGSLSGSHPHVALLQVGTSESSFVFDTHLTPSILSEHSPCGLYDLLTDASVVKVLHCCHGDSYALRKEHAIGMKEVFDTAVADAILTNRHPGSSRGLGLVLIDWLGDSVVHLTHKGKLVHVPFMFNSRPLTREHFVYSAEDVEYLVALYSKLCSALATAGFLELCVTLSSDRCHPHGSVPLADPRVAFVIIDSEWTLCLRLKSGGSYELPVCLSPFDVSRLHHTIQQLKAFLSSEWAALMGPAPSAGRFSTYVSSHMKKPRRLGNFFMAVCICPSLISIHAALKSAFACGPLGATHHLVLRPRNCDSTPFLQQHRPLIQHVRLSTLMGFYMPSRALVTLRRRKRFTRSTAAAVIQRCLRRYVQSIVRAEVNSAAPQQPSQPILAALVVHDSTHVFVVSGASSSAPWCFPPSTIPTDTSLLDAAIQGFDKYAGPAARKGANGLPMAGGSPCADDRWQLLPSLSRLIQDGLEGSIDLGRFGPTTAYFSCYVPNLSDHTASFYASRDDFNGFRLTPTEARKHPHAGVVTISSALRRLAHSDVFALNASLARGAVNAQSLAASIVPFRSFCVDLSSIPQGSAQCLGCIQVNRANAQSQESSSELRGPVLVHCHQCGYIGQPHEGAICAHCFSEINPSQRVSSALLGAVAFEFEKCTREFDEARNAAVSLFSRPISDLLGYTQGNLDSIARDVVKDFSKAYAGPCHSGQPDVSATTPEDVIESAHGDSCHSGQPSSSEPRYMAGAEPLDIDDLPLPRVSQPEPDSSSSTGAPDAFAIPKLPELVEAQHNHPAIAPYFAYHIAGTMPSDLTQRESLDFKAEVALTYIDPADGALRRTVRAVGVKGPLVLPPQFRVHAFRECHDRQAHVGVKKSWGILRRLYWWPHARQDLRMYIRLCSICRRMKVPRHKAGQGQVVNNGSSPWSFVTCDVYDVGWASGEFTKVLAFVDQFTRGVLCIPLKTDHTSEDIADAIAHVLMRFYGKPLAIRSDRGSVLISETIEQLYDKHKISMEDGTAYHHATAGSCERFFGVLRHMLLTHRLASKDDQWHTYLPLLETAYNNTINETTGFTPFFINHLRHPDLELDVLTGRPHRGDSTLKPWIAEHLERMILVWEVCTRQLGLQSLSNKETQDRKRETKISYSPGQQVILVKGQYVDGNLPKIEDPTDGPFTILKALPQGNYVLGDLRSRRMHDVINEERLMPWPTRRLDADSTLGQQFTVQRIVDRKLCTDKEGNTFHKYRVRWAGWHNKADSWRSMDSLQEVAPLVAAFNRVKPFEDGFESCERPALAELAVETPPVDPASARIPHFRALDGGVVHTPAETVSLDVQFPVDAPVEMLYANPDGSLEWYEGVITRSVLSVDRKGQPDLSYSIRFPGEPRSRSYKLSRNSLRSKGDVSARLAQACMTSVSRIVSPQPELALELFGLGLCPSCDMHDGPPSPADLSQLPYEDWEDAQAAEPPAPVVSEGGSASTSRTTPIVSRSLSHIIGPDCWDVILQLLTDHLMRDALALACVSKSMRALLGRFHHVVISVRGGDSWVWETPTSRWTPLDPLCEFAIRIPLQTHQHVQQYLHSHVFHGVGHYQFSRQLGLPGTPTYLARHCDHVSVFLRRLNFPKGGGRPRILPLSNRNFYLPQDLAITMVREVFNITPTLNWVTVLVNIRAGGVFRGMHEIHELNFAQGPENWHATVNRADYLDLGHYLLEERFRPVAQLRAWSREEPPVIRCRSLHVRLRFPTSPHAVAQHVIIFEVMLMVTWRERTRGRAGSDYMEIQWWVYSVESVSCAWFGDTPLQLDDCPHVRNELPPDVFDL